MNEFSIKNLESFIPAGMSSVQPEQSVSSDFASMLGNAIDGVNEVQQQAAESVQELSLGDSGSIHQVMIDMEKASINFEMMAEVRNKVLEAYQEVMRMQV